MSAPLRTLASINAQQSGWNDLLNSSIDSLNAEARQPAVIPRAYRVTPGSPLASIIKLVDFSPTGFEGCLVYVTDPEAGEKPFAYSDGTDWRYLISDTALTGII